MGVARSAAMYVVEDNHIAFSPLPFPLPFRFFVHFPFPLLFSLLSFSTVVRRVYT